MRKNLGRLAAAVLLATGIFAGGSGPADAAPVSHTNHILTPSLWDTGWGG